ncbi:6-bladed beta-propeller, partial [Methanoregula sp.]|uniref:6-bladed beta-propeller n=1 Tax=Methanoregula sp. TaxID=2052170 RepID=UPI003561C0A2
MIKPIGHFTHRIVFILCMVIVVAGIGVPVCAGTNGNDSVATSAVQENVAVVTPTSTLIDKTTVSTTSETLMTPASTAISVQTVSGSSVARMSPKGRFSSHSASGIGLQNTQHRFSSQSVSGAALQTSQESGATPVFQWAVPSSVGVHPACVAGDSFGNVYATDWMSNSVWKFTSDGTYVTKWGSSGTGTSQFDDPMGIAVSPVNDNVYVVDRGNSRIQVFTATGTYVRQWGSKGTGTSQFEYPTDIAVNSSGNVYVVDSENNRIQVFTSNGTFVAQWGSEGTANGKFEYPTDIA